MPTHDQMQVKPAEGQQDIWIIGVGHFDEEHDRASTLASMIEPLQRGGASILLVPLYENKEVDFAGTAGHGVDLDILVATHGSRLFPGCIYRLPAKRLFVAENDCLHLRPRDAMAPLSAFNHLATSLADIHGPNLHAAIQGNRDEAISAGLSAIRERGGHVHEGVDLVEQPEARGCENPSGAAVSTIFQSERSTITHDLRQPLQTLTLLQGLLLRQALEPKARSLAARMGDTLQQLADMIAQPAGLSTPSPKASASLPLEDDGASDQGSRPDPGAVVYVIDDDRSIRDAIRAVLEDDGCEVRDFDRCETFLTAYKGDAHGCLLVDAYLPGMSGLDLLQHMKAEGFGLPAIMITGSSDVQMAVRAMKTGATDFIEKPVGEAELIAGVRQALARARNTEEGHAMRERASHSLKALTRRQRQIMAMVLDGHPSKIIAADLGISQRTVENHRAAIMRKTGSRSLPALARLALALPTGEI